jgi:hypothetical protein
MDNMPTWLIRFIKHIQNNRTAVAQRIARGLSDPKEIGPVRPYIWMAPKEFAELIFIQKLITSKFPEAAVYYFGLGALENIDIFFAITGNRF